VKKVHIVTYSNGRRSRTWRNSHPGKRHAQSTYEALLKVYQAVSERPQNRRTSLRVFGADHSAFDRGERESHVLHQAKFH